MMFLSMVYFTYINTMSVHEWDWMRTLENINESVLVLICYHMVLCMDLLNTVETKEMIG